MPCDGEGRITPFEVWEFSGEGLMGQKIGGEGEAGQTFGKFGENFGGRKPVTCQETPPSAGPAFGIDGGRIRRKQRPDFRRGF
jgi:hypothetical protein